MERNTFLAVLGVTAVALLIGFLLPGQQNTPPTRLPWQVTATANGSIKVFGLTLEHTTLGQVESDFGDPAEVSLFDNRGKKAVEAYFDGVMVDGLKGKFVLTMQVEAATLQGFYDRGARIATIGDGTRKVTLNDKDLSALKAMPIATITYLPAVKLSEKMVQARFGKPTEVFKEPDSTVVHWMYPDRGVDIALGPKGNDVLQYVPPRRFKAEVEQPLRKAKPSSRP